MQHAFHLQNIVLAFTDSYGPKNKLKLPKAQGIKALEIGADSVYLRWAFLDTHSLSDDELDKLIFEIKATDNTFHGECTFGKSVLKTHEYKARIKGLKSNIKYIFQVRCKLKYKKEFIYSSWSNQVEFTTERNKYTIITDENNLEIESLLHQLNEYKHKCEELKMQNKQLRAKLDKHAPPHHSWDHIKIVEWIMRIQNGLFQEYKETLLINLKRDNINGKKLYTLTIDDLHQLGITKFSHKKILLSHIVKLTDSDRLPQWSYDTENCNINAPVREHSISKQDRLPRQNLPDMTDCESEYDSSYAHAQPPIKTSLPVNETHFSPPSPLITDTEVMAGATGNDTNIHSNEQKTLESEEKVLQNEEKQMETEEKELNFDIPRFGDVVTVSNQFGLTSAQKDLLISSPSERPPKKWTYKNGVLSLHVIKATNVDNMDEDEGPDSASDPYVQIELKGHYKTEMTQVIQNEENPVWNERFQLFPENPKKDVLKLVVWDKDFWTFDDKIGTVFIPLIDVLNANGHIKEAYDIEGSQCGAKLHLELRYKELKDVSKT